MAAKYYNQVPTAAPDAVATRPEFVALEDRKPKRTDPKLFIDESLVPEIEASGFIKALYQD